jgi:GxxExxY protein
MSDKFTYKAIGIAMKVHTELGPGLNETFYHDLLSGYLNDAGIPHRSHVKGRLIHKGVPADEFEADLLCSDQCILELKTLRGGFAPEHYVQLICYLKFWKIQTGLLVDFGKESLAYRRVNLPEPSPIKFDSKELYSNPIGTALGEAVMNILQEYGLGYRDTTYRGLLAADLRAHGLGCEINPAVTLECGKLQPKQTHCDCLLIEKQLCVAVLSLKNAISAADIAIIRNYARLLHASRAVVVNFGKTSFHYEWAKSISLCPPRIFGGKSA